MNFRQSIVIFIAVSALCSNRWSMIAAADYSDVEEINTSAETIQSKINETDDVTETVATNAGADFGSESVTNGVETVSNGHPIEVENNLSSMSSLNVSLVNRMGKYQYEDGYFGAIDGMMPDARNNYDYDPNNRVAPSEPPTHYNDPNGYTIDVQRLADLRKNYLYWFFDKGGSNDIGDYQSDIHASIPQLHKNFNFQLPFYGFRFNYTRVSMHGFLEFSDPPEYYTYPLSFPVKDWPKRNDPSFIGIFFSKCRIGRIYQTDRDQRTPGVYFRQERDLQTRTDRFGVEVRERVMWDIREGVVGADTFVPKHVVIVTWKNMSFAGGIDISLYKTNSFQMVLATDEVYTYAIFNYINLMWSSHTEAGGDTTGGEGGVPAFIGFNAGNGTQSYEYKPYSQASVLRDLTGRGWANGFPGRHIFRLDEKIMLGTCNKDIDAATLPLVFAPESGNMLGGTVVNITGPCFNPTDRVTCHFDAEEVEGHVIDRNRAICVQPLLFAQGYIRFEVSVGTDRFKYKAKYFVETPATATERIFFKGNDIYEKDPKEILIEWNKFNLTTVESAGISISLYGYRERTIRPELEYIDMLESGATNTGMYVISSGNYRNRDNRQYADMQFGFIKINLTNPEQYSGLRISPVLWSKPIPLAWYFNAQWERIHGKNWPRALCDNWIRSDRFLRNFAAEIPVCPCILEHAINDKGRFMPDIDCDRDTNPTCLHHKGAIHCVRTGQPNVQGSEQQCCYDRNGFLLLSYDQKWGSRPRRNHNFGTSPWNEANKVPTLSTWYNDVRPYYSCCAWQDEQAVGCETFRFERRPTQDCVAYQSPAVGSVFGDPHVVTFDGLQYTFNGMGEFVLVHVNDTSFPLDVQGRFEQVPKNIHGQVMATQLTSIVARGNFSTMPIEVRVRPKHAQWRYRLDVFADGRKIYFDRPSLKFQAFQGVTVYTPTYVLNQSEVIIMFSTGAGVEVVENEGFLSARVYLPWNYINKTRGLMGTWSWDMADDFTLPDGRTVAANLNNFEGVHRDFAMQWMLADRNKIGVGKALFTRDFGRVASYFANATFQPNYIREPREFLPPNRTEDIERASELCGESYQCRFDYGMSLNRDMAFYTKMYYDAAINIKSTNEHRVISCGALETPRFGRKSTFLFTPGTHVTFECNEGFMLIGDTRRSCTGEGKWDPPVYGYTECLREVFYARRAAWIATGIVFAAILPIILCIVCAMYWYRKKARKVEPGWKMSLPRSRAGSRSTLRHLNGDSEVDGDTLKKSRSYEQVYRTHEPLEGKPNIEFLEKKWDLDEEDITSSEGGPDFIQSKIAKDISYISAANDTEPPSQHEKQTGRRNLRNLPQQQPIQEESYLTTPPVESPTNYSPTYAGFAQPTQGRQLSGAIRVLPPSNTFFSGGPGSPESSGSPVLTQNVGLPSPPLDNRSTEV